jgi:NitT/TauT family transport system substrate-binding protein
VTLNVGAIRSGGDLGLGLAMERGYFQQEGMELNLVDFTTAADMMAPLAVGQLDVAAGGVNAGVFNAVAQGVPLKIVADLAVNTPVDRSSGWLVRTDLVESGRVREPRDLKGLTVGLGARGSLVNVELAKILEQGGLTEDDVELKLIPFPDQIAAFANQSIDLAYVFEPFLTRVLDQDLARMWWTSADVYPNHESTVLFYGPSMVEKREPGQRFMVAFLRGVREVQEQLIDTRDPAAIEAAVRWSNIKDPALWRKMELQQRNPDGYNYRASLEYDLSWLAANGYVQRAPRLDDMLDQSYVDYAIARLGRYRPGCGANPCR